MSGINIGNVDLAAFQLPCGSTLQRLRAAKDAVPLPLPTLSSRTKGLTMILTDEQCAFYKNLVKSKFTKRVVAVIQAKRGAGTRALIRALIRATFRIKHCSRVYLWSSSDPYTAFCNSNDKGGIIAITTQAITGIKYGGRVERV